MLSAYQGYQLSFKSISRAQFDLICTHIKPDQVISLILSDSDDTPGQSELFFSRFQITDFTRTRMLKLINIGSASLEDICRCFREFAKYHRISIESYNARRLSQDVLLSVATQIKIGAPERLISCAEITSRSFAFPVCLIILRCLTISQSSMDDLKSICKLALRLTSLKVENLILNANEEFLLSAQQLRRLVLYCKNVPVSMNQMEQLLMNLPQLKYFEISAKGSFDLTNGYLWESLTYKLVTFNFNFWLKIAGIEEILNSFRTLFWIERKKWFVVATRKRLFSIPHFSKKIADTYFQLPLHTTIPHGDETLLFDKVTYFILNNSLISHQNYFRYIKTLEIKNTNSFENLSTLIDLNHVENFILSSSMNHSTIATLMKSMPSLQQFSINTELQKFFDQTKNLCFEQIRILEINQPIIDGNFYVIEQLVRLFPNIEILRVNSIRWKLGIARLLDKFENLWSASFRLEKSSTPETDIDVLSFIRNDFDVLNFIRNEIDYEKYEAFHNRCRPKSTTGQNQGKYYDFWIKKRVSFSLYYSN
ncbi:unnamed protein product [Adineta steineri]|uniref:F-box domain-containing protein n=1 Tax=Adineta steineri TaxID=433720 RepID=A0A815IHG9_9BILA|nr:unnamed protein product [Adineta steineri]